MVPDAQVAACRELTKLHEEVLVGTPAEVSSGLTELRGEFTLVVSRIPRPAAASAAPLSVDSVVDAAFQAGLTPRTVVELLRAAGIPRRDAYRAAKPPITGE
jgi:16S rRNA (cytidine1402-2'-O)-methyltransferase